MTSRAFLISGLAFVALSSALAIASQRYPETLSLTGTLLGTFYGGTVLVGAFVFTHVVLNRGRGAMLKVLSLIKIPLLLLCLMYASSDGNPGLISFVVASLFVAPASLAGAVISERLR